MQGFIYILNLVGIENTASHLLMHNNVSNVVDKVISSFELYQVTIFADDMNNQLYNLLVRSISNKSPTVLVDLKVTTKYHDDQFSRITIWRNPRSFTLYIIFQDKLNFDEVNRMINHLINYSPHSIRPKCLLISSDIGVPPEKIIYKEILMQAWILNFLDFSILSVDQNHIIHHVYNPFTNIYIEKPIDMTDELFPDKLMNVNNYPLKVAVFDYPPFIDVKITENSSMKIGGSLVSILKILSEKLNFSNNFVHYETNSSIFKTVYQILEELESNELDVLPLPCYMSSVLQSYNVLISKATDISKSSAFVPILKISKEYVSINTIIYLLVMPIVIYSFILVSRILRFSSENWNEMYILQTLLGTPQSKQKHDKTAERIIYLSLIILSIIYLNNAFSSLFKITVIQNEVNLNTFHEIYKADLPIYMTSNIYKTLYNESNAKIEKFFIKLKPKVRVMDHIKCLNQLLTNQDQICFAPHFFSCFYIENYIKHNSDHKPVKVSDISTFVDNVAIPFKSASPYAEKFNNILIRVLESGIWKKLIQPTNLLRWDKQQVFRNTNFIKQITIILCLGYSLAVLVLIVEIINDNTYFMRHLKNLRLSL